MLLSSVSLVCRRLMPNAPRPLCPCAPSTAPQPSAALGQAGTHPRAQQCQGLAKGFYHPDNQRESLEEGAGTTQRAAGSLSHLTPVSPQGKSPDFSPGTPVGSLGRPKLSTVGREERFGGCGFSGITWHTGACSEGSPGCVRAGVPAGGQGSAFPWALSGCDGSKRKESKIPPKSPKSLCQPCPMGRSSPETGG